MGSQMCSYQTLKLFSCGLQSLMSLMWPLGQFEFETPALGGHYLSGHCLTNTHCCQIRNYIGMLLVYMTWTIENILCFLKKHSNRTTKKCPIFWLKKIFLANQHRYVRRLTHSCSPAAGGVARLSTTIITTFWLQKCPSVKAIWTSTVPTLLLDAYQVARGGSECQIILFISQNIKIVKNHLGKIILIIVYFTYGVIRNSTHFKPISNPT